LAHGEAMAKAAEWVVDLETADSVDDMWPQFEAWLQQDLEHGIAFSNLMEVLTEYESCLTRRQWERSLERRIRSLN
jgi:ferric-dicitrate binding protein FerR (iron transport regulator)